MYRISCNGRSAVLRPAHEWFVLCTQSNQPRVIIYTVCLGVARREANNTLKLHPEYFD
jgi:hypothetical protein